MLTKKMLSEYKKIEVSLKQMQRVKDNLKNEIIESLGKKNQTVKKAGYEISIAVYTQDRFDADEFKKKNIALYNAFRKNIDCCRIDIIEL